MASYYSDNYMNGKEGFRKIGPIFGVNAAEEIADHYRKPEGLHEVIVTHSETRFNKYNFYSIWVKDIPVKEWLLSIL